ncbi:MAG: serine/threonine-protein kinase [Polyangiales bacterium]
MEVPKQARVIANRYRLESLVGEGGMASVWRARDLTLERPVAVKLLFARDERDKNRLVQQFVREARIAASVHHRNVIQIVDFGTLEEQQPFMVMELLEGETLGHRLHREPPLPCAELVRIASLTLRGLAAVHDAGIIHRDLKPDNIFLASDGTEAAFPKILDFGISRSVEPRSGRRSALTTREGMIVGTPEYMSPEQARGVRGIDKRTDIYSMGAILYEGLTGRIPFASENVGDLIIQIVTGVAPRVHEVNPHISLAISDVVAKAMSRAVEDRYQDAPAMQHALLAAAEQGGTRRSLSDLPPPPPPSGHSGSVPRGSLERLRTLEFSLDDRADSDLAVTSSPPAVPALEPEPVLASAWSGSRRRGLVISALAVALASIAAVLIRGTGTPSNALPNARAAEAKISQAIKPESANAAGATTTERPTITVSLRNVPKTAQVSVDGQPASGDEIELPRDGRNRVIRVTSTGMVPWQVVHHASADATFEVALVKDDALRQPQHTYSPVDPAHTAAAAPKKAHKKPPSALRKLDF